MFDFSALPLERRLQILQHLSSTDIHNLRLSNKANNKAIKKCLPQFFLNRAEILRKLNRDNAANQNYLYAIEIAIVSKTMSRDLLNSIMQTLPNIAAGGDKILVYLAQQLYQRKATTIYVKNLANINNAFVGHLLNAYKHYISQSRSHAVKHIYDQQINLIVILLYLLHKQFPVLIPDMSSLLTLSNERGNAGAVAAYVDRFEQQQGTYLGAYASDDSDGEPIEAGKYPNNVNAAHIGALDIITKGKKQPPQYTVAAQPNGFQFVANNILNTSSAAITCWLLRNHKKRLHGCIQNGNTFEVTKAHLNPLLDSLRGLITRSFATRRNLATLTQFNNAIRDGRKVSIENNKIKIDGHILPGEFFIPLFRGEAHLVDRWTPEDHTAHYYGNIVNVSEAVMNTSQFGGFSGYKEFEQARQSAGNSFEVDLHTNARQLKKALIELRNTNPMVAKINGEYRLFDNTLVFLQQIYSNGIERFLPLLKFLKKLQPNVGWDNLLPNHYNPFLSFAELPDHALRYGFGDKNPYSAYRVRPRWRNDGVAEHLHVGICYSVLAPLAEFMGPGAPNALRQMRAEGTVGLNMQVGPEAEVSFLSYFDKSYICEKLGMKFPNFNKPYHQHYYAKYGLDLELYNLIRNRIVGQNRWTNADIEAKIEAALYQWLKAFHSLNMLLNCYQQVYSEPGRDIIYLTEQRGVFSFDLPNYDTGAVGLGTEKTKRAAIAKYCFTNSAIASTLQSEIVTGVYENGLRFAEVSYDNLKTACRKLGYAESTITPIIARSKTLSGYIPPRTPKVSSYKGAYNYLPPSPEELDLSDSFIFDPDEQDSSLPELEGLLGNLNFEDDETIFDPQTGLPLSPIGGISSSSYNIEPKNLFGFQPLTKTQQCFAVLIGSVQKVLRKYKAHPDGNCGFYSLQLSRKEIVDKLLAQLQNLATSSQLCQIIAPEIADALLVGELSNNLPQSAKISMQLACSDYYLFREGVGQRIAHIKSLLNSAQRNTAGMMPNEQFIYWLMGQNFVEQAQLQTSQQNLLNFYQANQNALQQLINFAQDPTVVNNFIASYLNPDQWLTFVRPFGQQHNNASIGLIGAIVVADIVPGICIYQQNAAGQLQPIYTCGNVANQNTKHLLYNGYNHFDALLLDLG